MITVIKELELDHLWHVIVIRNNKLLIHYAYEFRNEAVRKKRDLVRTMNWIGLTEE